MKDKIILYAWHIITVFCYRLVTNKKLFMHVYHRTIIDTDRSLR